MHSKLSARRNVQKKRKETPLSSLVTDSLPNHNNTTRKRSKLNRTARKCTPTLNNNESSIKGEQSCHKNEAYSSNPPTENVILQQNQVNDGDITIANRRPQRIPLFNLNEHPNFIMPDEDESNLESITKNDTYQINAEEEITNAEDVITNAEDEITNATKIREADLKEPLNNLPTDEEIAQIMLDFNKNGNTIRDSKGKGKEIVAPTSCDLNKKDVSTILESKGKGKEIIVAPTSYHHNKNDVSTIRDSKGQGKEIVAPTSYDLSKKNVIATRDSKGKGKEIVAFNPKDNKGKTKKIVDNEEKPVNLRPARKIGKRCQPKMAKPHIATSLCPIPELPPMIQVPELELPDEDEIVNITSEQPKENDKVWFKLSPSEGGNGGILPPLTSPHILAWDQEITIDKVKMFIATKLNLEKEEIEVILGGFPVMSPTTMTLHSLQEVWKNLKKPITWKEGEPPEEESVLSFTYARSSFVG